MLNSMTGFGSGQAAVQAEELQVEVRSWNHKFCDVKVRLPRELAPLESSVSKAVKDRIARGSVEVFVRRKGTASSGTTPSIDLALAKEYHAALRLLARELDLSDEIKVHHIADQVGVIRLEERAVDLDLTAVALQRALSQALDRLEEMRRLEGDAIRADLKARLSTLELLARQIERLAPKAVAEYQQRLAERVSDLARGIPVDPQRLAQEVAFFAERSDIAEEISRLSSHLDQFRALMESPEPSGRKMEFLVQEMNREVNTTGSKSQHPEISSHVVAVKAELERIREQVQNVE